jgi:hypothetical protein
VQCLVGVRPRHPVAVRALIEIERVAHGERQRDVLLGRGVHLGRGVRLGRMRRFHVIRLQSVPSAAHGGDADKKNYSE